MALALARAICSLQRKMSSLLLLKCSGQTDIKYSLTCMNLLEHISAKIHCTSKNYKQQTFSKITNNCSQS